jgi:hypothetical protein
VVENKNPPDLRNGPGVRLRLPAELGMGMGVVRLACVDMGSAEAFATPTSSSQGRGRIEPRKPSPRNAPPGHPSTTWGLGQGHRREGVRASQRARQASSEIGLGHRFGKDNDINEHLMGLGQR